MDRGQTSLEVRPNPEKPLFVDRFNASRSSIQEDQSYTSVLPEPVRVADKEAAAAMGRVNGFSRQSANLTGWLCGLGELSGEKWLHIRARQTPAALYLLMYSQLWGGGVQLWFR